MFNWLRRVFDSATGLIDSTIVAWISGLINGLYGYLHGIFGLVHEGWTEFEGAAFLAWHAVTGFMDDTVALFYRLLKVIIPAVVKGFRQGLAVITKYAEGVYHWALHEFALARAALESAFNTLKKFVIDDIWRPLDALVTSAWKWIDQIGDTIWHYITHPATLVDLIWDFLISKLEAEAWNVGAKLGKFFLSLVIHNARRFLLLLEDIFDAVL